MGAKPIQLEFSRDGLYFRMVTAYLAAACGLLIFRKELRFDETVKVGLASEEEGALEVVPKDVKEMFEAGGFGLGGVTDALALMLVNSAYETTVDHFGSDRWLELRMKNPELEFFRHLRNAASHGGVWNLRSGEPRRPAQWRGREIDKSLDGKGIFEVGLKPGDLLIFLHDVEDMLL